MTLNSKHRTEKIKTKNQRNRNIKTKTQRRRKPCFTKRIGRKCRPIQTRTEQNNDYMRIMHKIQFRSSFRRRIPGTKCFFCILWNVVVIKRSDDQIFVGSFG